MAPISASPLLIYASGAVSCLPIALGINALIRPSSPLELLGWPIPTDPYGKKLALNLMRVYGGRNIALGLSMAIPAYFGHRKALGWMVLGSSVVAIVDGFVSRDVIGGGEWGHWGILPITMALGAALVGLFD
ncbi:hypothetical protein JCM24511_08294 [Saitozyma sp. JCM 24511]|nr:hypothetical protein JCM24511_08294 [Saitozyma sp. JCM 24511]